ncbi:hypothetical protein D3C86_2004080 [compost metagenome]
MIPNWHIKTWRVAYWDHIGHPKVAPKYDVGTSTWWIKPGATPAVTPEAPAQDEPTSTEP